MTYRISDNYNSSLTGTMSNVTETTWSLDVEDYAIADTWQNVIASPIIQPIQHNYSIQYPTIEEFYALQEKVKELEDMMLKLWQAKAVGDLL